MNSFEIFIFFVILLAKSNEAFKSNFTYHPMGYNPLLYTPGQDPIIHLDQYTFNDTIFQQNHAFVVEFYADWCGHCRAFAPFFRSFAYNIQQWKDVVYVAAINCADEFNQMVCKENEVHGYPMIKYFLRNARSANDAVVLRASHSLAELRGQVAHTILNEYSNYQYPDWPNFVPLVHLTEEMWKYVKPSIIYLAIIFEKFDAVGAQFLLDLNFLRDKVTARRASSNSVPPNLQIGNFPSVVLFQRNQSRPIFISMYGERGLEEGGNANHIQLLLIDASRNHYIPLKLCRALYYVSETDMLKAMRMAIYDEVIKIGDKIQGDDFIALYNFIDLLATHFPVTTFATKLGHNYKSVLKKSSEAQQIFKHLRDELSIRSKEQKIAVNDWIHYFLSFESLYGNPFPVNASWQHCKGSSPEFRGYTCGLWTTFHAITVHAYMNTIAQPMDPLKPLLSIKGWVSSYFGCLHCRRHFIHMTTNLFPMNSQRVRRSKDMVFYLWRAHNIVNRRLHGDSTEDPQFEKRQFPPSFICPLCYSGGQFSRKRVRNFLLKYYGTIVPHRSYISLVIP
ncbi:unnamed protein product [Dracunculus medinensis]|uniref:Sulfhydryl oxidase n=1 Tax=Dracunculus medinensis TaxID=318479 RepID=A0A158Q4H5_DRAME|nr:unnamed protein product [Dracunculus medinensis]